MRCLSCNSNLTDQESTRKSRDTAEYLDTCNDCLGIEFLLVEEALVQRDRVTRKLNAIQEESKEKL